MCFFMVPLLVPCFTKDINQADDDYPLFIKDLVSIFEINYVIWYQSECQDNRHTTGLDKEMLQSIICDLKVNESVNTLLESLPAGLKVGLILQGSYCLNSFSDVNYLQHWHLRGLYENKCKECHCEGLDGPLIKKLGLN